MSLFQFRFTITVATFLLVLSPAYSQSKLSCDHLLFSTGLNSQPSAGTKQALIDAANRGESIRVGWGLDFDKDGESELIHWADAAFLTVWEGEVFTQVDAIHTQSPKPDEASVDLRDGYVEWRGSLGTTGRLEGRSSDGRHFPADIDVEIAWCSAHNGPPGWALLYRNGSEGEPLAGSKQALHAAIRSGLPIHITWGLLRERDGQRLSVEHTAAPIFTTITNENHVVAQLPEHIGQRSYWNATEAFFDDPQIMWRGLMATTGTFDAVWVDRASGETVRR